MNYNYNPDQRIITVDTQSAVIILNLNKATLFPFMPPLIKIVGKSEDYISLFDMQKVTFEDIMREHWHPSIKVVDILERAVEFVSKNLIYVDQVPGKVLKKVHGLEIQQIFPWLLAVKVICMLSFSFHGLNSSEIKAIQDVSNHKMPELYEKESFMQTPLAIYLHKLIGLIILAFQQDLTSKKAAILLSLIKSVVEIVLLYPMIVYASRRLHGHYHKTVRLSLLTLTLLLVATLNIDIISIVYLACLIPAFVLIMEPSSPQTELSAVLFGLSNGLTQLNVWIIPIYIIMQLYVVTQRGGLTNINKFNEIVSRISQTGMIFLMVTGMPWIEVISHEKGFEVLEKALFRIYLENYQDLPALIQANTLTGNIWSILPPPQNGNFFSLLLYGILLAFFGTRSSLSKLPTLLLSLSICLYLPLQLLHLSPQTLPMNVCIVLLSMSSTVKDRAYLNILHLLFSIHSSNPILTFLWQYLSMNFIQSVESIRSARTMQEDEETKKKVKGINWYFRVQVPTEQMQDITIDTKHMWIMHALASLCVLAKWIGTADKVVNVAIIVIEVVVFVQMNMKKRVQIDVEEHSHKPGEKCSCQGINAPVKTKNS